MERILISTDFSANATHAAQYGYNLAKHLKANVVLCNAVLVPAQVPQAGVVVWPMDEYDTLIKSSAGDLLQLKHDLKKSDDEAHFKPSVSLINESGVVADVINNAVEQMKIDMIVMGTHGSGGVGALLLGNHSRNMINATTRPLLLIPPEAKIDTIKKIAYATDFKNPDDDLEAIYKLIDFARRINANVLITHVTTTENQTNKFQKWLNNLLIDLSNTANYPHIYYRIVRNDSARHGLDWLCEHGHVDMLVMLHRPHHFLDTVLKGSYTQKMANHIPIPLLVFPAKE
jgi:nucleotide-binding universal stress UspA family protein